jgi:hypothetical protein
MISTVVMADPRRAGPAKTLAATVGADIVWDEHRNVWDTARRALLAFNPASEWHLVIQDDAIPCQALTASTEAALERVPTGSPSSIYLGAGRPFARQVAQTVADARRTGASWVVMDRLPWGVAIAYPTSVIPDLVAWADRLPDRVRQYDRRVSRFFEHTGVDCWHTLPSLVDHPDGRSLANPARSDSGRHAHWFVGQNRSALDIDWTGPAHHATRLET